MFDKLADPLYRLNNLYYITDKTGKKVKFKMTAEQLAYFQDEHHKNIILKARQLGFTTQVCIMQLDCALFESKKCALIAHTLHDAKRLFREKVKFAYDNLPELVRLANPVKIETKEELVFENGGSVTVSTSFRGGTLQRLHVSEFGKICAKYPDKAREIVTGAFEAVPIDGIATLESTAEGRQGYFFEYCQQAEKDHLAKKDLTAQDWRFFFFSWWQNPEYQMPSVELPERLVSYFNELKAKHGISTTAEQQAWYYAKEKTLGDDMGRFVGADGVPTVSFNTNFATNKMTAQERAQLIAEWQGGAISFGEMRAKLVEDEIATIEDAGEAKALIEGELQGYGINEETHQP